MGVLRMIPWLQGLCKGAFRENFPYTYAPRAFVFDAAGGLYQVCSLVPKVSAGTMFNLFMRDAMKWAERVGEQRDGHTYHLVLVMDKRELSAVTKAEEQARRAEQRKKQVQDYKARTGEDLPILPEDHAFIDAYDETGNRLPDAQQPLYSGLSILQSKNGTASLLRYFEERLLTHPLPDNVCLWVDLIGGNAFRREVSAFLPSGRPNYMGSDHKITYYSPELFGEGEVATAYYAVQLSKLIEHGTIALRTDDTDIVPIVFSARDHMAPGVFLHWIIYKNQDKWLDLDAVFATLRRLGFTPSKFVYYCAMRGCDHVNKQALTPRFKDAQVIETFLRLCKETADEPVWDDEFQVQRLVCTINPTLLDKKLYAEHCNKNARKMAKTMDDVDMTQLFAASGSAKLKSVLSKQTIQRLLSLHAMWNPNWGAFATV